MRISLQWLSEWIGGPLPAHDQQRGDEVVGRTVPRQHLAHTGDTTTRAAHNDDRGLRRHGCPNDLEVRDHVRAHAHDSDFRTMGHLTCASQSTDELVSTIESYRDSGMKHVLAVRGDMPGGPTETFVPHPRGLANATELVRLVKEVGDFCVGVAAFPDAHPQAKDPALDARLLVAKAEAGAEFAVTQLFFDADAYFRLVP